MIPFFVKRLAAAAALAACSLSAQAEAPFSFAATAGKLPKDVVPVQYAAHLVPNLATNTFLGSETIEIDVLKETRAIVLNAANLHIDSASLSGKGPDRKLTPVIDKDRQLLSFPFEQPLAPGRYQLAIKFHGSVNREARGLFAVPYKVGATAKNMLATQMEPSDARRLLPLWDEPAFRANFKLTVDLPAGLKAFSNMPVAAQESLQGGLVRYSFGTSPKMPSYLLVLVAGELERKTARQDGVEIGVVTTAGKQGAAAFALASTKDLLRYYNKYFDKRYPLPKLDQIAIPGGFGGAMENWGGIVYNDAALLYDPKTSPASVKQSSFRINAHEVAHQWFGNLVTMAWWDNLWLNEGFASWMAAKASDHFYPEWDVHLGSLARREEVMNLDALKSTHPIQTPVETEEQAANAFDAITYIKGQSFLRMLEAYLGEEPFRNGMRGYMARHQYSNTTSADLWTALEKGSGKPVAKLAADWTTQPGFPLIKVSQVCEDGKRRVTLAQEQYRIDEPAVEARLWHVPVQLGIVGAKPAYTLLSDAHTTVVMPGCDGALVADPEGIGYFRIQYDSATFDALAGQVARLPAAARYRLLSDTWSMVQAGRVKADSYFKLAAQYAHEPRLAVWQSMAATLDSVDRLARGEPERAQLRRFAIDLASPLMGKLGWTEKKGESVEERQLRALLARMLADAGDPAALRQGRMLLARYLADAGSVPASLLDFAFESGGRQADRATHAQLTAKLFATQNAEERMRVVRALSAVEDEALAERSLAMALSKDIPAQSASLLVPMVARVHVQKAWDFAVANRAALVRDLDALGAGRLFPRVVEGSADPAHAIMLEQYAARSLGPDAQAEAKRAASGVHTRAAQKRRLLPQIGSALK